MERPNKRALKRPRPVYSNLVSCLNKPSTVKEANIDLYSWHEKKKLLQDDGKTSKETKVWLKWLAKKFKEEENLRPDRNTKIYKINLRELDGTTISTAKTDSKSRKQPANVPLLTATKDQGEGDTLLRKIRSEIESADRKRKWREIRDDKPFENKFARFTEARIAPNDAGTNVFIKKPIPIEKGTRSLVTASPKLPEVVSTTAGSSNVNEPNLDETDKLRGPTSSNNMKSYYASGKMQATQRTEKFEGLASSENAFSLTNSGNSQSNGRKTLQASSEPAELERTRSVNVIASKDQQIHTPEKQNLRNSQRNSTRNEHSHKDKNNTFQASSLLGPVRNGFKHMKLPSFNSGRHLWLSGSVLAEKLKSLVNFGKEDVEPPSESSPTGIATTKGCESQSTQPDPTFILKMDKKNTSLLTEKEEITAQDIAANARHRMIYFAKENNGIQLLSEDSNLQKHESSIDNPCVRPAVSENGENVNPIRNLRVRTFRSEPNRFMRKKCSIDHESLPLEYSFNGGIEAPEKNKKTMAWSYPIKYHANQTALNVDLSKSSIHGLMSIPRVTSLMDKGYSEQTVT